MARFQLGGEIWQIVQTDRVVEITMDRTTKVRRFVSAAQARALYDQLVATQLAAGFRPIEDAPPLNRKVKQLASTGDPRQPQLERAIELDPDDRDAFGVYGDWLQGQGDARGEWIALLAAAAREPAKREDGSRGLAHQRAARCFGTCRAYLEGVLGRAHVVWRDGFARRLSVASNEALADIFSHPSARFAVQIELVERGPGFVDALRALANHAPAALQHVELLLATQLNELHVLAPLLPRLRRLTIGPRPIAGTLGIHGVELLARASLPALQRLAVGPFGEQVGEAELRGLFALDAPALTHLRLRAPAALTAAAVAASPLASRLQVLELRGPLLPADVTALLDHRDRFGALRELWVGGHGAQLPSALLASLSGIATHVIDIVKETQSALHARYVPNGE